jgi:putative membrane protein
MKPRLFLAVALLLALAACKREENYTTDTGGTATDTMTTSTMVTNETTGTLTGTGATGGGISTLTESEKIFIMKTAQGGMAEVGLGTMAAQDAANADVKAFANRMFSDHGKANDELKSLAVNKGIALPTELDPEHKSKQQELSGKTGADFDKAYMDAMVADHEKTVADFEQQSTSAQDADLKAWVSKTLPTLQDHLKMAKDVRAKLK